MVNGKVLHGSMLVRLSGVEVNTPGPVLSLFQVPRAPPLARRSKYSSVRVEGWFIGIAAFVRSLEVKSAAHLVNPPITPGNWCHFHQSAPQWRPVSL
jgi:hypothetical protein